MQNCARNRCSPQLLLLFLSYSILIEIDCFFQINRNVVQNRCRPMNQWEKQGFSLILSWPSSYCLDGPADECPGPSDWVINGFRPMQWARVLRRDDDKLEFCCTKQRFNKKQIQYFLEYLKQFWPPDSYTDPMEYFNEQWSRYGTCAHDPTGIGSNQRPTGNRYDQIDPAEYFAMALDLQRRLPIKKWLEKDQIHPSNHRSYPRKRIEQVLNKYLGDSKYYQLKCYHSKRNSSSHGGNAAANVWNKIRICFDDTLNLEDCGKFHSHDDFSGNHNQPDDIINGSGQSNHGNCDEDLFWVIK